LIAVCHRKNDSRQQSITTLAWQLTDLAFFDQNNANFPFALIHSVLLNQLGIVRTMSLILQYLQNIYTFHADQRGQHRNATGLKLADCQIIRKFASLAEKTKSDLQFHPSATPNPNQ
jgi:hypothetical protein